MFKQRRIFLKASAIAVGLSLCALAEQGQTETGPVGVDVELVLAADNSASMFKLLPVKQGRDYAAAFRHERLYRAINAGPLGRIAVVYFEWSDQDDQRVIVPWTLIETREDMVRFADALEDAESVRPNGETSISGAMYFAQRLLDENRYQGHRQVVDISSNGRNSDGPSVPEAKTDLLARGATINVLVLPGEPSLAASDSDVTLKEYFEREVIGGPGAFTIQVKRHDGFGSALLRKLVLEIAWLR